ncbi:sulfite reductase (NADPH) flavoprotein alpha-component [Neisseria sp. HSC-16F19]|nr:assimilatory sulfite reductase (NADPH) flavoprotein subunit [Neisseria sp. HSC-16F19]MCP2040154.1 sulfite reductase (NADPH) flavoprotein alpha-component [Neisseria sp. HSC-16F19]
MNPLPSELLKQLDSLDTLQLAWLSGFCWARSGSAAAPVAAAEPVPDSSVAAPLQVTVLSASQTGNARGVAAELTEALKAQGIAARHIGAADYKPKNLAEEQVLLLVSSTQGEGEPPEEAVSLHKFLHGKKAPQLKGLQFAVLGLGDSSYPKFCGAARDFDERLAALGATRLADAGECDLDYQAAAAAWVQHIVSTVQALAPHSPNTAATAAAPVSAAAYNKENPFAATLLTRQKITGRYSDKDVRHIELDLAGSGLQYQAGDALGVWFDNDPALADEILAAVGLAEDAALREALIHDLEITQNTPQFVRGYAAIAQNPALDAAIGEDINAFVQAHPIVGIVQQYPAVLSAEQLRGLLRPLTPRLYSISSAQDEVGEEVHLTVGALHYRHNGHSREGGASGFLTRRAEEDSSIRVFVEPNPNFRLPENDAAPVIMIGSGTGIAPFRAFVQQRAARGAEGRNWLIFGNPHASEDFLYQTEWQQLAKDGYLHRYHFAWSRDQEEKVYVQHKIREQAAEVWQWLQQGAHVYVCGDAARMAKDVETALIEVIAAQGGMSRDDADEFLDELRQEKRYQRDVY